MSANNRTTALIFAILAAAAAVSGALFYSGSTSKQEAAVLDEQALNDRVDAAVRKALDGKQLSDKINSVVSKALEDEALLNRQVDKLMQLAQQRQVEAQRIRREAQQRAAQEKARQVRRVSAERDHIRGDPDATISLIEYSDFECPFCKRFHETPGRLLKLFDGKINWAYRHFPLDFHNPGAQKQAEATECAAELGGNDAFWKYTDALFKRTRTGGRGFPVSGLAPMAKEFGLDEQAFQACLDSGKYVARVKEDLAEGANAGITGTPGTILINNQTGDVVAVSGAQPITVFEKAIRELLQKPVAPPAANPAATQ